MPTNLRLKVLRLGEENRVGVFRGPRCKERVYVPNIWVVGFGVIVDVILVLGKYY